MKFHSRWAVTALFVFALGVSSVANAALYSRLGGLAVYDSDFNITWLADANYAGTSGYAPAGSMTWSQASAWAAGLTVDGISGWRLPTSDTCLDYNCTGSEMGHLFYTDLGGVAGYSILTRHNPSLALFQNVQSGSYWSATEYVPNTSYAWHFDFDWGAQGYNLKTISAFAWAVRTGDVAAVPVPASAWLFGSGLLGLVGIARARRLR